MTTVLRLRVISTNQLSETRYSYIYAKFLPTGSFFRPFVVHRPFFVQNEHLRKIPPAITRVQVWNLIVSIPDLCTLTYFQTILIQNKPTVLSGQIWVQTVCYMFYRQTPLVHVGSTFMHIFAFCHWENIIASGFFIIHINSFVASLTNTL